MYGGCCCDGTTASDLLYGQMGVCVDWSALIFSLGRSIGVPSNRIQVWSFDTVMGGGHAVTGYYSDSAGWIVLDTTCCQAALPVDTWISSCGGCECRQWGCWYTHTDFGTTVMFPGFNYPASTFSSVCGCVPQ